MNKSEFTEIANFALEAEASHFQSVLQAEGIPAFIDGAATNTMLSYVGTALGGIRLFVKTSDVSKATQVLGSRNTNPEAVNEAWSCGACEVEVDEGFQVCWSCGQARPDVENEIAKVTQPVDPEASEEVNIESESLLRRAWRASIIGLGLLPVLTHLYSMILLIRASMHDTNLSADGQRLFYWTLLVNIFAICVWSSIFRAMFL